MARDTYKFVKATGRDRYLAARRKELEALLDPATGMVCEKLLHSVKCTVCGSPPSRHDAVFFKEGFRFVKCRGCGMVFVNPQLDPVKLQESYKSVESQQIWVDVLLSGEQMKYDTEKFRKALATLERFAPERGRLLDVGCSLGIFLKEARARGWETAGVELGDRAREYAVEKLGLEVLGEPIENCGFPAGHFDVVTLWEVLEHLPNPRKILKDCYRVLKPGGIMVILVPNADALACRIMRAHCSAFCGRNHLWYFNATTLTRLLDELGYRVLQVSTELTELDTITKYLGYNDPYEGKAEVKNARQLLGAAVHSVAEDLIFSRNWGYKLHVLARKADKPAKSKKGAKPGK